VSVDINDVNVIKIINKSRTVLGVSLGIVIGGAAGALAGYEGSKVFWQFDNRKDWVSFGGAFGMVLGWMIGATLSGPKTIQFEGESDSEIKEILEKLRKKARVRNFQ
jgi:hypothetical protein